MRENFPIPIRIEKGIELRQHEQVFFAQLIHLPDEIAKVWQEKYDEITLEEEETFFKLFNSFLKDRSKALGGVLEIEPDLDPVIIEEILDTDRVIKNTFGDPNYFEGNGRVAEVYRIPTAPHLCVKYVKDQAAYNEGNHLRKEEGFLCDLRAHKVEGVRTPIPYFLRIHPSEGHSYGMERINGKSLSQMLERQAENVDLIRIAKGMDKKETLERLTKYIKSLHQTFKITHGDLFLRNLMLDKAGNFFVIDFGKSEVEEIGQDHEMRRNSDMALLRSEITKFFSSIDKIDLTDIIEADLAHN
jgi:tRNA A-37 threonylcarbamoyl transferase component Bud32